MQISGSRLVNFSCCQHHNKIQTRLFAAVLSPCFHLLAGYLLPPPPLIYYADLNKSHQKEGLRHNAFLSFYIKVFGETGSHMKRLPIKGTSLMNSPRIRGGLVGPGFNAFCGVRADLRATGEERRMRRGECRKALVIR